MAHLLTQAWAETFHCLRKHKTLFVLLVVLQLAFFALLFTHAFQAQLAIGQDLQQWSEQVQQANYNPEELKEGKPFIQDPLQMLRLYSSLKRNFFLFAVQFSSIFLLGQGIVWLATHHLFASSKASQKQKLTWREKLKIGWHLALKYLSSTVFFYGIFFLIFFFTLKLLVLRFEPALFGRTLQYFGYASLVVYYLLTVALALIEIPSWRDFTRKWFLLAVKKYYVCLPLLLLSLLPTIASFFGIFYAVQINPSFPLMLLFTGGVAVFLVLGRVFFVAVLREMHHHREEGSIEP